VSKGLQIRVGICKRRTGPGNLRQERHTEGSWQKAPVATLVHFLCDPARNRRHHLARGEADGLRHQPVVRARNHHRCTRHHRDLAESLGVAGNQNKVAVVAGKKFCQFISNAARSSRDE